MSGTQFIQLLSKAGPVVLSAGGVGAVIWLAVDVVPREREGVREERAKVREIYVQSLEKAWENAERTHDDHAEIMRKLDELLKK